MAETAAVISRDKEEIQNSSDDEDRFPTHNAATASPGCSASPSLDSLYEDKGISAVPERLSVLSSRAVAQVKALAGPEMVSGGQAQMAAPGLAEHPLAAVDALLGGSSYPVAADSLQPEDIASLHPKRPCWDGKLSSKRPCGDGELSPEALQAPRAPAEASKALQARAAPGDCRTQQAGSSTEGSTASGLDRAIWMKTTKVMETLENKKKEEKERYRLQLAMYRRLLLLRSIRSLHRQLEQQQARLQECYGSVINTKKEVLKHICSASPSPSP